MVDLGRLGATDRDADLALLVISTRERWASPEADAQAVAILFDALAIGLPDMERRAFYLRFDPLTWG